jgi:type VI secretion system protein ImpK
MAEESKQNFDPDATVALPAAGTDAGVDPDATVALPMAALDPDATVSGPIVVPAEPDPEATFTGQSAKKAPDVEATDRRPAFDPDATVNPAERASFDPDATSRIPSPGKLRHNPFAPKSTPDSIHANLATLGGLNPLIALANPILGAVPQIRRTLRHPDPAGLRANLRDQIESLQTSASFAEVPDASVQSAVYALCALLDESAAATPWGGAWIENGLLKEVCGESGGGEGFFTRLDQITAARDPVDAENADLLEFYDVCLALGFEGRYRKAEGGRLALLDIRGNLYSLIARRRPRPGELSGHWRSATAEAAAAPALQMAAEVTARLSAQQAAGVSAETTLPPVQPSLLSRIPRRAVWSALGGVVGVAIVFYLAALRLLDDEAKTALAPYFTKSKSAAQKPAAAPATESPSAPAPSASTSASAKLAKALEGLPVTLAENAGRISLSLRHEHQFPVGHILPAAELRPVFGRIAAALNGIPGTITVTGHADSSPTSSVHWASNVELSAARARAVAQLMAPKLSAPGRLKTEGKGDAEPIAAGNTAADRARNRRITITVTPSR